MIITYDTPIEVTQRQYLYITRVLAGFVAHLQEGDRFYIKLWIPTAKTKLKEILLDESLRD